MPLTAPYKLSNLHYITLPLQQAMLSVAERPRDASCLSVVGPIVSVNSTIPRAQSFIISHFGIRFTNAYTIKFCSVFFVIPVESCCHKQDLLMSGDRRHSSASVVITYTVYPTVETVDDTRRSSKRRSQSRKLSKISRKSRFLLHLRGPCRKIAIMFDTEKLESCGYPTV